MSVVPASRLQPYIRSQVSTGRTRMRSLGVQVLIFWALLGLCPIVAVIEPGSVGQASSHAQQLIGLEKSLGIANEAALHDWLEDRSLLSLLTNAMYFGAHLSAVIGLLLWAWARRPTVFPIIRNTFACTQLLLILGYGLYPTTPPRLLNGDVSSSAGWAEHLQFAHAAFPSGHVAFAVVVAIGLWQASHNQVLRALGVAYPIFVTWMVVATGNHYWLDAAGGIAVAGIAYAGARLLAQRRPVTSGGN